MRILMMVVEEVNKNSYLLGMAHQTKKNREDSLDSMGQDSGVASKEDIIVICNDKDSNGCRSNVLSSKVSIKSMYFTFIITVSSLVFVISHKSSSNLLLHIAFKETWFNKIFHVSFSYFGCISRASSEYFCFCEFLM